MAEQVQEYILEEKTFTIKEDDKITLPVGSIVIDKVWKRGVGLTTFSSLWILYLKPVR